MTNSYPKFQHHGAVKGVTGSCHRFIANADNHFLVDCGLFQGEGEVGDAFVRHQIDFDITSVKALIVTHVHIDHVGRLPYLVAAGFNGPIYCSIPSAKLLPLVIEDALKIGFTRDKNIIERFLNKVEEQLVPLQYNEWFSLLNADDVKVKLRLQRAGHILGSAYVELETDDGHNPHTTVFSGDLGAPHAPLLPAPESPEKANTLIIESTYGDKCHEDRETRILRLKSAIEHALENKGTVIVPAFSIGRTQELLYELEELIASNGEPGQGLEIIVDSPLAAKFTEVYRTLKPYWDEEAQVKLNAGRHPLSFDNLYTVNTHEEHLQTVEYLATSGRPAVVLAASGMVTGGRVLNYVKAMLEDARHAMLFVGYQARGTHGFYIQKYGSRQNREAWVEIDGKRYTIKARVETIGGYSAHADQEDLVNFVRGMDSLPQTIRIVHGDAEAKSTLREKFMGLANELGVAMDVLIPES
ncbi:Ribonuclease [Thalassocella blandensis]|nr:Ribonuclease [Thalassocella blandensis]